ncbi:CBS domain-containing protein [Parvularcula lutaonensis]|uniref:CBS domain-containing protein n=1 Tax=Parvularcula lutaonensis TaxID=491923 RepID=A0ABV7MAA5_9PROT|nr:CBS domain-containing protein [Parvularcula lutaonensis]GGY44609.1 signal transduction protein [Parvularcula lutaonensis]
MRAQDIVSSKGNKVETLAETARLGDAIDKLAELNIGALLIVDAAGKPSGILSERDLIRVMAGAPMGVRERKVSEVMTRDLITCSPDATVDELLDMMTDRRIRHLPVMRGDELVGILSIGDVVKHRIREVKEEAEALKSYIASG